MMLRRELLATLIMFDVQRIAVGHTAHTIFTLHRKLASYVCHH